MKYNNIRLTDRQRVIAAHEDERDWKLLARTLGINLIFVLISEITFLEI